MHMYRKLKNKKSKWWERWQTSRKFKTHNWEWKTRPSVFEFLVLIFKVI